MCIGLTMMCMLPSHHDNHVALMNDGFLLAHAGFVAYAFFAIVTIIILIFHVGPIHGQSSIFVYVSICSLAGSLSVMACKALGVAIKLTIQGNNQLVHPHFYLSIGVVLCCVLTQMNYLNKALDLFNTAIVSPVYYVMFTLLTILASIILFRDIQSPLQIVTEMCGFVTIVIGTLLLHTTRDMDIAWADIARMSRDSELRLAALNARDRKAYLLGEEMMPLPLAGDDGDGGLAGGADGVSGSALDKPGHMSRKAAGTTIRIAKA